MLCTFDVSGNSGSITGSGGTRKKQKFCGWFFRDPLSLVRTISRYFNAVATRGGITINKDDEFNFGYDLFVAAVVASVATLALSRLVMIYEVWL